MEYLQYSSLLLLLSSVTLSLGDTTPFQENYVEQRLDHFNYYNDPSQVSTFKQRYLMQDKWWSRHNGGPIFFYTGNEGDIVEFWNNTGQMFELAVKFHALVVFCEHRFYGKSLPFGPEGSFEQPHVHLLTVEQALADFAVFVDWLKTSLNATKSPVIAFGGSYGGMLSAYMRFKFPNLIAGSIAASAPVYLVVGESSRDAFFQDVTKDFSEAVAGCDGRVREGFSQMMSLAAQGDTGLQKISAVFNLCPALKTADQVRHLVGWIRNAFTTMAMFDYPYASHFSAALPPWPVKAACSKLVSNKDALQGLADAAAVWYGSSKCSDIWTEYVECSDPTGCGTGPGGKAWSYQACTDFLMPAGTNNVTDMFPVLSFTLSEREQFCKTTWNVIPQERWTSINLWGKNLKAASNIVFSNGLLDPWHRGGVLEDVSDTVVAIQIKDGAHHLDLRATNKDDPPSVTKARQLEAAWIHKWIQEAGRR